MRTEATAQAAAEVVVVVVEVAGLYAAGRCAAGVASNYYVSGLSLADCLFAGRRAGRHAATGKTF